MRGGKKRQKKKECAKWSIAASPESGLALAYVLTFDSTLTFICFSDPTGPLLLPLRPPPLLPLLLWLGAKAA